MNKRKQIILTGASGWVGKNALYYHSNFLELQSKLKLFSSKNKVLNLENLNKIFHTKNLNQINNVQFPDGIFHTAFLKRDFIKKIGLDNYVILNRKITEKVFNYAKNNNPCPIIIISTGSVKGFSSNHIQNNPYSYLKKEEEEKFRSLSKDRMILILRVFAAIGPFIEIPSRYAFGEFLNNAENKKEITIKANNLVFRSYIYLQDLVELCFKILKNPLKNGYYEIDACTDEIEIYDLARIISNNLNNVRINKNTLKNHKLEDRYCGDPKNIMKLMNQYDVLKRSLEQQIIDSIKISKTEKIN